MKFKFLAFILFLLIQIQAYSQVIKNPDGTAVNWKSWQNTQTQLLYQIAMNGSGGTFGIQSIEAGDGIDVNYTDSLHPVISVKVGNGIYTDYDLIKLGHDITEVTELNIIDTNRLFIGSRGKYGLNINEPIPSDFEDFGISKVLGFNAQDTAGFKYLSGILLYDEETNFHLNGQVSLKGNPFSEDMQQGILAGVLNQNNTEDFGGDTINEVQILNIWKDDDVYFQRFKTFSPNREFGFATDGNQAMLDLKGFDLGDNTLSKKFTLLNQSQQPLTGFTQDTTLFNFQTFDWSNNYNAQFLLKSDTAYVKTNGTILIDSKTKNISDPWEGSRYYFSNSGLIIVDGDDTETSTSYSKILKSSIILSDGTDTLNITPDKILIPKPPASGTYVLKSVEGVVQWISE